MEKTSYESKLAQLTKSYIEGLPKQLSSITSAWQYLQHVNWDKKALTVMAQGAHKLVGSGETFRFPAISSAARALEEQVQELLAQTDARTKQRQRINESLGHLSKVIEQAIASSSALQTTANSQQATADKQQSFHIAIIEDDTHQADYLQAALQQQGYKTTVFIDPDAFSKIPAEQQFDLILLDIGFPKGPLEGITWLAKLKQSIGSVTPVIVLSARADMVARMRALRAGAEAYLVKPVDLSALSEKIEHIKDKVSAVKTRILWVDDDAELLAAYENLLTHEGYQVECVNQPLKLLEHIERFLPDVIVLDYQMPNCNGVELAQLLKQDSRFMTTPIIFVSASAEAMAQKEQLSIVGNAFLKKPLDNAAFLKCLRQQIAKADLISHRIKQISQRFEKNGLQNQTFFLAELESVLAGIDAALDKDIFYLVQATVDQEDYLRQTHGLRPMAKLTEDLESFLAQHSNVNGVGCMLGGASFLLLLRAPSDTDKTVFLNNFHQSLQQEHWTITDESKPVTLSLGALPLNQPVNLDKVLRKVETACAQATSEGGNRVTWQTIEDEAVTADIIDDQVKALLRAQAFKLFFQPIVNLQTGDTLFEALIRLEDDDKVIYPPSRFLPWADKEIEGGVYALDSWVIEHAIQALSLNDEGSAIIIKLSSSLSQIIRLLPFIKEVMQAANIQGQRQVVFALPESLALKDIAKTATIIHALNAMHCGFMLEHAGASAFSAQLINDLTAIDYIKLAATINTDTSKENNLKALIAKLKAPLAKDLKMIATGIEDAQMLAAFWDSGVAYFQGYFIQKPSEAMAYEAP